MKVTFPTYSSLFAKNTGIPAEEIHFGTRHNRNPRQGFLQLTEPMKELFYQSKQTGPTAKGAKDQLVQLYTEQLQAVFIRFNFNEDRLNDSVQSVLKPAFVDEYYRLQTAEDLHRFIERKASNALSYFRSSDPRPRKKEVSLDQPRVNQEGEKGFTLADVIADKRLFANPQQMLEAREAQAAIENIIASLPPELQLTLSLFATGYSHTEVKRELRLSERMLQQQLGQARTLLQATLRPSSEELTQETELSHPADDTLPYSKGRQALKANLSKRDLMHLLQLDLEPIPLSIELREKLTHLIRSTQKRYHILHQGIDKRNFAVLIAGIKRHHPDVSEEELAQQIIPVIGLKPLRAGFRQESPLELILLYLGGMSYRSLALKFYKPLSEIESQIRKGILSLSKINATPQVSFELRELFQKELRKKQLPGLTDSAQLNLPFLASISQEVTKKLPDIPQDLLNGVIIPAIERMNEPSRQLLWLHLGGLSPGQIAEKMPNSSIYAVTERLKFIPQVIATLASYELLQKRKLPSAQAGLDKLERQLEKAPMVIPSYRIKQVVMQAQRESEAAAVEVDSALRLRLVQLLDDKLQHLGEPMINGLATIIGRTHPVILFRIRTAEASCQKAS